jgi:nucleoside-diphosphate-sugar epimerase
MKICITGFVGFVGSHFTRRLLTEGHQVTGVDIRLHKPEWVRQSQQGTFPKMLYIVDDCRRFFKIEPASEYDLIIHCAAVVGGRLNIEGDPLAVATNLSIDAELWNWVCRAKPTPRVIYFSSSAVYPAELQTERLHCVLAEGLVSLDATRFGLPDQTYGFAKFAGELLARQAVQHYGVEAVIYRPFSGYGEDQSLDYPFPSIIKRVAEREDPITIWGSGDQKRDFIHIDDIVDMVLATYHKMPAGTTLNLGSGEAMSFRRLAELVCWVAGHRAEIVTDPTKPEGVFSRVADTYQMEQWGLKPKVSLLDGIKRALNKHLTPASA